MVEFFTDLEKQIGFDKTRAKLRELSENPNYGKEIFDRILTSTPKQKAKLTSIMVSDLEKIVPRRDTNVFTREKIIQPSDTIQTQ